MSIFLAFLAAILCGFNQFKISPRTAGVGAEIPGTGRFVNLPFGFLTTFYRNPPETFHIERLDINNAMKLSVIVN